MNIKIFKKGDSCTVNLSGDIAMEYEVKPFLNRHCIFEQLNKSGLVMISLESNHKLKYSVPQKNISEWKEDENE